MSSLKLEPLSIKESLMQEFVIQSMSCGGCASRIAQAVKNLDAAAKIEVDLPTKTVRVDSAEDRASVIAALTEAGYPPK
jgi:copper chaperone